MSNPKYRPLNLFLPEVNAEVLGAYKDTISGKRKLILNDVNPELPGQTVGGTADDKISVKMSFYHPGAASGKLLKLNDNLPSDDYKHRILVYERHYQDGRKEWPKPRVIAQVNYSDAGSKTMDEMYNDAKEMINSTYGEDLNDRVKAYKAWIIEDGDSTDASKIDITIDGTTTTVTSTSAYDISADINTETDVNDDVLALNLGSDKHLILVVSEKTVSIEENTDITIEDSYLYLKGFDAKKPFDVEVYSDFAEIYDFAMAGIDISNVSTADVNIYSKNNLTGEDTVTEVSETSMSGVLTAVNDAVTELAAYNVFDTVYIVTVPEVGRAMMITIPKGSTLEQVGLAVSGVGQKPKLDYDSVYDRFANVVGTDEFAHILGKYIQLPRKGVEYCQLSYKGYVSDHRALHGAGHAVSYLYEVNLFMPYDDIKNGEDHWLESGDTANNAYAKVVDSPTKDFGELIEFWTGTNPMT